MSVLWYVPWEQVTSMCSCDGRQQRLTRQQRNCGGGSSAIAAAAAVMYGRRRLTGKLSRIAGKGLLSLAVVIGLDE